MVTSAGGVYRLCWCSAAAGCSTVEQFRTVGFGIDKVTLCAGRHHTWSYYTATPPRSRTTHKNTTIKQRIASLHTASHITLEWGTMPAPPRIAMASEDHSAQHRATQWLSHSAWILGPFLPIGILQVDRTGSCRLVYIPFSRTTAATPLHHHAVDSIGFPWLACSCGTLCRSCTTAPLWTAQWRSTLEAQTRNVRASRWEQAHHASTVGYHVRVARGASGGSDVRMASRLAREELRVEADVEACRSPHAHCNARAPTNRNPQPAAPAPPLIGKAFAGA